MANKADSQEDTDPVFSDSLRVLLVEDGNANQILAMGLLRNWGHEVELAENGAEAVEAWQAGNFDVILMDVQMPVMDGLEATRRIRELEPPDRHIPIIAMTARAMKGDREKCLESGMDEYLPKPVRKATLQNALSRCSEFAQAFDVPAEPIRQSNDAVFQLINLELAKENTGNDLELFKAVLNAARDEIPKLYRQLSESLVANDLKQSRRFAHTIKGSCNVLAAPSVHNKVHEIETAAADENLSETVAATKRIEPTLNKLMDEIDLAISKLDDPA